MQTMPLCRFLFCILQASGIAPGTLVEYRMTFSFERGILSVLLRQFDHDLWANLIWCDLLDIFKTSNAQEIMQDIMEKQEATLRLCCSHFINNSHDLSERFIANCEAWKLMLQRTDLSQDIAYTNILTGCRESYPLYQIAQSIYYDGIAKRGMLALLAAQEGWLSEGIPHTGPLTFERHMQAHVKRRDSNG